MYDGVRVGRVGTTERLVLAGSGELSGKWRG